MDAVLISIQPKWVEKIVRGEKTIEGRKNRPKFKTPFKCYIYCTKEKNEGDYLVKDIEGIIEYNGEFFANSTSLNGKVVGEFICDRVDEIKFVHSDLGYDYIFEHGSLCETCLTDGDLWRYGKGKPLYGWHISNLVIYDNPKELGDFYSTAYRKKCCICIPLCKEYPNCALKKNRNPMTRPPQSWCYVEDQG